MCLKFNSFSIFTEVSAQHSSNNNNFLKCWRDDIFFLSRRRHEEFGSEFFLLTFMGQLHRSVMKQSWLNQTVGRSCQVTSFRMDLSTRGKSRRVKPLQCVSWPFHVTTNLDNRRIIVEMPSMKKKSISFTEIIALCRCENLTQQQIELQFKRHCLWTISKSLISQLYIKWNQNFCFTSIPNVSSMHIF